VDRGKKVGTYVRQGQSNASVEITLKQPVGDLRIKRSFDVSNHDSWEINGKKATKDEVTKIVKKNNIMLNNLCHFLPQEKVQAFAEMAKKPTEMLKVVETAVGPDWMLPLHEELVAEQKQKSRLLQDADSQSKELHLLKKKEEDMRDEINRFVRLKELDDEISIRRKKIPWIKVRAKNVHANSLRLQPRLVLFAQFIQDTLSTQSRMHGNADLERCVQGACTLLYIFACTCNDNKHACVAQQALFLNHVRLQT
jgi:chromosome segregation ATPase